MRLLIVAAGIAGPALMQFAAERIPHHTTNDNVEEDGAGRLTTIINVSI